MNIFQESRTADPGRGALVKKILVKHGNTLQPALQAFFNQKQLQQLENQQLQQLGNEQVDSLNERSDNTYSTVSMDRAAAGWGCKVGDAPLHNVWTLHQHLISSPDVCGAKLTKYFYYFFFAKKILRN